MNFQQHELDVEVLLFQLALILHLKAFQSDKPVIQAHFLRVASSPSSS